MTDDTACDLLSIDLPNATRLREHRLPEDVAQAWAASSRALGDPLRLVVLTALADTDDLCVCDLSWIADRSDKLVSHHLRVLRAAGLVTARKDGKLARYRVTPEGRRALVALGESAANAVAR